ncbi:MAG: hypothetical protein JSV79_03470 [Armatimonadota bacterium]|nr:MAG: hypothetical protein JSV79_03470 [Armatimonadota bacterium]
MRLLRVAKWGLFLLGCALALWPLAMAVAAWRAEARLEEAVQELVRGGEPVEASQLAKSPIPDGENAALVYQQAFDAIELSEEDEAAVKDLTGERASLDDPETGAQAREILARNAKALDLIHRAATMPRCDFRVDWSKGFDVEFPHLSKLRTSARLLAFESLMLVDAGRVDEAIEVCGSIFALSNAADEPCLIGILVRYAIIGMGTTALQAALRDTHPAPEICQKLASEIDRIDLRPFFVEALKGERAFARVAFAAMRSAPDFVEAIEQLQSGREEEPSESDVSRGPRHRKRQTYMVRWMLACDELEYLSRMGQVIELGPRPYRDARTALKELDNVEVTYLPPRGVLTCMLLPVFDRAFAGRDRAIARLHMAEVALLLKAYRIRHDAYPESLAVLKDFAGRELPDDPFSGAPLAYRRDGDGFVLYSWGVNLQDDGGTAPAPDSWDEGDIVVRCLR